MFGSRPVSETAVSCANPIPVKSPRRSNGLSVFISSSTSSVGKSSSRITSPSHNLRNRDGSRAYVVSASDSNSASEGACKPRQMFSGGRAMTDSLAVQFASRKQNLFQLRVDIVLLLQPFSLTHDG